MGNFYVRLRQAEQNGIAVYMRQYAITVDRVGNRRVTPRRGQETCL